MSGTAIQEFATTEEKAKAPWRFFLYSGLGIFAFFVPFPVGDTNTILLDHIVGWLKVGLGDAAKYVVWLIILAGAVVPFYTGTWRKSVARRVFAFLYIFAAIIATMLVFNFGPSVVFREELGPFLMNKLVIPVGLLIPVGAPFLGLLVGFGLMEFIGVFVQPIMRPLFKTPGRSAVDAVASFVGSYSLGLLVTDRVYKAGGYTSKEASIIAAGFSTASATFMVVIAKALGLMSVWGLYFGATLIVTFIVTAIMVRVPPISSIPDEYYPGVTPTPEEAISGDRMKLAWLEAKHVLKNVPSLMRVLWENFRDGMLMTMQVLPGILSIGFLGLILAYYTPIFEWIGYIFYPLLWVLQIPDTQLASEALAIGLSELFLPATIVADSPHDVTRILIAIVSVSQIFFFSSMVPSILATEIPLKIKDILAVWFIRVVLSVVVAAPFAYLIAMAL